MKKLIRLSVISLSLFCLGCFSRKHTPIEPNKNDSYIALLNSRMKHVPLISYIYEKLKNVDFSDDSTVVVKPIFDVYRRQVLQDFGEKYIGNDTVIIIEAFSFPFGHYFSIIYTSNNKDKIMHYYFSDDKMKKEEINVEEEEIIKYVQSNQLSIYIEAIKHKNNNPPTSRIISLFVKRNNNEYDFTYFVTSQ